MKITMTLNGAKIQKEIPISWKEVTFSQFIDISECGNDLAKVLSVFTGIDEATLKKVNIVNLDTILEIISFIGRDELDTTIPKSVMGYAMPERLETQTIGQFEDMKIEAGKIKDASKESLKSYAMICAIHATNPYDYSEAESKLETFMNAPCEEVLAIGNFTLVRLAELMNPTLRTARASTSRMQKWRLVMRGWLRNLVFTARYYSWKRKLRLTERSYYNGR